jgi:hypothetical protein
LTFSRAIARLSVGILAARTASSMTALPIARELEVNHTILDFRVKA